MEEAKIGGLNSKKEEPQVKPLFPETIPAVLGSEDLVFEIGKMVLKVANAEKVVQGLVAKEKAKTEEIAKLMATIEVQKKNIEEHKNSIQRYQQKLENLGVQLRDLKEFIQQENIKTKILKEEKEVLAKQVTALTQENERLKEQLSEAQKANEQLVKKIEQETLKKKKSRRTKKEAEQE